MMNIQRALVLAVAVALVATACGDDQPTTSIGPPVDGLAFDGAWVLTDGTLDGEALALDDDYRVTMTIEGRSVGGRAACNHYGGTVSIADGAFSVGELSQTEMACERRVMEIESLFLQGLGRASHIERTEGTVFLSGTGVDFTFELLPPVPTAALLGTTWVLDTIIQGETATSTAADADPATLRLTADGTFVGGTGCRGLSGEYIITGDTVQFTSFGADGECPTDLQWQDSQVISVLEGGFTADIEGGRLTVSSSGGEGLSYRAGE